MPPPKKKPPKRPPKKRPTKRPPKKRPTKSSPKKKPGKKGGLIKFASRQPVSVRLNADGGPKSAWLEFGPLWLKSNTKGLSKKTNLAAITALKKFKQR